MVEQAVQVVHEVAMAVQQITGYLPDTQFWLPALWRIIDRGIKIEQVLLAFRKGLLNQYHKERLCDGGIVYIEKHFTVLVGLKIGKNGVAYEAPRWKIRKWEAALHAWEHFFYGKWGREPNRAEREQQIAAHMQSTPDYDRYVDASCDHCNGFVPPLDPAPSVAGGFAAV